MKRSIYMMFEVFITPTHLNLLIFIAFQVIWPKISLNGLYLVLTSLFVISIKIAIKNMKLSIHMMFYVFIT